MRSPKELERFRRRASKSRGPKFLDGLVGLDSWHRDCARHEGSDSSEEFHFALDTIDIERSRMISRSMKNKAVRGVIEAVDEATGRFLVPETES